MPDNNRIFYACQAVYVDGTYLQNVQAAGIDYAADATGISDVRGEVSNKEAYILSQKLAISIQREVNTRQLSPSIRSSYQSPAMKTPIYSKMGTWAPLAGTHRLYSKSMQ